MSRYFAGLVAHDPSGAFSASRFGFSRRSVLIGICILFPFLLVGQACKKAVPDASSVTLTLLDQYWPDNEVQARHRRELLQFTQQTGIRVEVLPAPEAAVEQLATWLRLMESGSNVPDVYAVDVIWPGIVADHLLDLKAYVPAQEIGQHVPELIANGTVNDRLVTLPYDLTTGRLYYRTDLLRSYGYRAPPATWDELETMARRIQNGERARGDRKFWGFVWQGAPSEALTCNALEWQASEGGGPIIENGTITGE